MSGVTLLIIFGKGLFLTVFFQVLGIESIILLYDNMSMFKLALVVNSSKDRIQPPLDNISPITKLWVSISCVLSSTDCKGLSPQHISLLLKINSLMISSHDFGGIP